jgi:hypothetical protein
MPFISIGNIGVVLFDAHKATEKPPHLLSSLIDESLRLSPALVGHHIGGLQTQMRERRCRFTALEPPTLREP